MIEASESIEPKRNLSFTWRTLLRWAALGDLIILIIMGIVLRDRLPLGLAVVVAIGLGLLSFRSGLLGDLVLGLLFVDITLWTLTGALSNVAQGEEFFRLLIPASLAAISGAGSVAAVAFLLVRRDAMAGSRAARLVALVALAFFGLVIVAGLLVRWGTRSQAQVAQPSELMLRTENMAFDPTELSTDQGEVTMVVDNQDLWWHTFTIDALGVDLKLPSSGKRQISFQAEPGTYEYYCSIPGHDVLGMRGKLIVR